MNIFDKTLIYDRIKDAGFPLWSLSLSSGYNNRIKVMQYWGDDFTEDDNEATKIDKSIKRLDNIVTSFPPDSVFIIEIRPAKQSNSSTVLGPFMFMNEAPKESKSDGGTLAAPPAGYVHESALKGLEDRLTSEFDNRIAAMKMEYERQRKEDEYNRRVAELDRREKELKDIEKGYNSTVAKTSDIAVMLVQKLGALFLPGLLPTMPAANAAAELGAAHQAQAAVEQQMLAQAQPQVDAKSDKINQIAALLYNQYDEDTINKMLNDLTAKTNGSQSDMADQHAATDISPDANGIA